MSRVSAPPAVILTRIRCLPMVSTNKNERKKGVDIRPAAMGLRSAADRECTPDRRWPARGVAFLGLGLLRSGSPISRSRMMLLQAGRIGAGRDSSRAAAGQASPADPRPRRGRRTPTSTGEGLCAVFVDSVDGLKREKESMVLRGEGLTGWGSPEGLRL